MGDSQSKLALLVVAPQAACGGCRTRKSEEPETPETIRSAPPSENLEQNQWNTGEGAIRLPKASRSSTSKSLKTKAKENFTLKRGRAPDQCETDCDLTSVRREESAVSKPGLLLTGFTALAGTPPPPPPAAVAREVSA